MSFKFVNPDKVKALRDAGFTGIDIAASAGNPCNCGLDNCGFDDSTQACVSFNPPSGISGKAHGRAIKAALSNAGF